MNTDNPENNGLKQEGNSNTQEIKEEIINTIPVTIQAVLGETIIPIDQVLKLRRGSVIELNRKVGDPIDLYINKKLIAKGEVTILDQSIGITLTEIIS